MDGKVDTERDYEAELDRIPPEEEDEIVEEPVADEKEVEREKTQRVPQKPVHTEGAETPKRHEEGIAVAPTTERTERGSASGPQNIEERRRELHAKYQAEIDELRDEHDEAIHELMLEIRQLRERAKKRKLSKDEIAQESAELVSRFRETDHGNVLRSILPDRANAKTLREKLADIVAMGLRRRAWDDSSFTVEYTKRYGREVEERFKRREDEIGDRLSRELAAETMRGQVKTEEGQSGAHSRAA